MLNIKAFPDHLDSYLYLARLLLLKGEHAQAERHLHKVLAIQPGNSEALEFLKKVQLS
jgi:uncharacterized protein HemY